MNYKNNNFKVGHASLILAAIYLVVVIACALMERIGVPAPILTGMLVITVFLGIAAYGLSGATMQKPPFLSGDLNAPVYFNASGKAAAWLSAGYLVVFTGLFGSNSGIAVTTIVGCVSGFLILGFLIGPDMAKSGSSTIASQLRTSTGSPSIQFCAAIATIVLSAGLLSTQLAISTMMLSALLGYAAQKTLIACSAAIFISIWIGGSRSNGRVQSLSYFIILTGFLAPAIALYLEAGISVFSTSDADAVRTAFNLASDASPILMLANMEWEFPKMAAWNDLLYLALCFAAITAILPHLLVRITSSEDSASRRRSWALAPVLIFFPLAACLLYIPLVAGYIDSALSGLTVGSLASEAGWIFDPVFLQAGPALKLCGYPATNLELIVAACGSGNYPLESADIIINAGPAGLILSVLEGLPSIVKPVFLLAIVAAAFATSTGLLHAVGVSVAEDLYGGVLRRSAPSGSRLAIARISVLGAAIACTFLASLILENPARGFWLAGVVAAGLLPPLLLSGRWAALNTPGILIGMFAGFAVPGTILFANSSSGDWASGLLDGSYLDLMRFLKAQDLYKATVWGLLANFLISALAATLWPRKTILEPRLAGFET